MSTDGIEAVFVETHNWGKSAKFFQSLGYELEFGTWLQTLESSEVTCATNSA